MMTKSKHMALELMLEVLFTNKVVLDSAQVLFANTYNTAASQTSNSHYFSLSNIMKCRVKYAIA